MNPALVLNAGKKIDEGLGLLSKVLDKLKGKPDVAAGKLADALDEVAKTWEIVDRSAMNLLRLGIDEGAFEKGSETLLAIEGGALLVGVQKGRGHCHVIGNIFQQHLDRWFDRVFKGDELNRIKNVFYNLANADDGVFAEMEQFAEELQFAANQALNLVLKGKKKDAQASILALRADLLPARTAMNGTLAKLFELKSAFIRLSGVT